MRASRYNIYKKVTNKYFVFNTAYSRLVELAHDDYTTFKSNADLTKKSFSNPNTLRTLTSNNFVVDNGFDELKQLEDAYIKEQYSKKILTLTVAPSLQCNFCCSYCYENKTEHKMTEDEQKLLMKFIKKQLDIGYNKVNLVWFGGEPLLVFDIIKKLTKEIIKLTDQYHAEYSSCITTNGYLLTKDIAGDFKKLKIDRVFITLDGVGETHDKRRCLLSGKGTFEKIAENIKMLEEKHHPVLIRMNIDKSNCDKIQDLTKFVDVNFKSPFYLGHVRQYTRSCNTDTKRYLSKKEYAMAVYNFDRYRLKKAQLPKRLINYCRACKIGTYVVDPRLNLYKCENDIGRADKKIDSIRGKPFLEWNPFNFKKCRECKVLPLCMGGCPFIGIANKKPECSIYKYTLGNILRNYIAQGL